MQSPGEMKVNVTDMQAFRDATRDFMEVQRSFVNEVSRFAESSLKVNENGASFYEKLIFFDGTAIALTVTFLGFLSGHLHSSRNALLWLVCPAWALLLLSMYCCSKRVTCFYNANNSSTARGGIFERVLPSALEASCHEAFQINDRRG